MRQRPSRLRRLDDALADLPLDAPMLLTELDGFLTGILVCPERIVPAEWLPVIWGAGESGEAPFDDPADVQWFTDAVMARYGEIARDLGRGRLQPIFDVDRRNGDVLWEPWMDGFAEAAALRPDSWTEIADSDDDEAAAALSRLLLLAAVARDESPLDSLEIDALHDHAPADIAADVSRLHAWRSRRDEAPATVQTARPAKIGRNEPCPCGSGRKSKHCCA